MPSRAAWLRYVVLTSLVLCVSLCTAEDPSLGEIPGNPFRDLPLTADRQSQLRSYLTAHKFAAAEELLALEAERASQPAAFLRALADVLFLDSRQSQVIAVLRKVESLQPLSEHSHFLLALAYVAVGQTHSADIEFEGLAETNPSRATYPYWRSRLAHRRRDYSQALRFATKAVDLDPRFTKGLDQLGLCLAAVDNNEQAILAFQRAIESAGPEFSHWPWPTFNLGTLYLRLNRLSDAELTLRKSITVERTFPPAHFRLGQVLERRGALQDALKEFKLAIQLDPTYPDPHYALARLYRSRSEKGPAEQELALFKTLRDTDQNRGIRRPE